MTDRIEIDVALVGKLIQDQFPHWSDLELRPVARQGWDNQTFRIGDHLSVRLPSAGRYAAQVEKEQKWLPVLGPSLPLAIPVPVAKGVPGKRYPYSWSILEWIPGDPVTFAGDVDVAGLIDDLSGFLRSLHRLDTSGGPAPGAHNFFRGGALRTYDRETRTLLDAVRSKPDAAAAGQVWKAAFRSAWDRPDVWVHGDLAPDNLLIRDGRLRAVLDFGCLGIGDPACDLVMAWTWLPENRVAAFRDRMALDEATWARARGWALWKALLILDGQSEQKESERPAAEVFSAILQDHAKYAPQGLLVSSFCRFRRN